MSLADCLKGYKVGQNQAFSQDELDALATMADSPIEQREYAERLLEKAEHNVNAVAQAVPKSQLPDTYQQYLDTHTNVAQAVRADKAQVYKQVHEQLATTGYTSAEVTKTNASLISEFVAEQAKVFGIRPTEYYAKFPVQITSPLKTAAVDGVKVQYDPMARLGTYTPSETLITLNGTANTSTVTHEIAHFFLDTMGKAAVLPDAPQKAKDQFQQILDWFGVSDAATWNAMSMSEQRDNHEKFARSFELYLLEGKSPSVAVSPILSQLQRIMVAAYNNEKHFLAINRDGVPLNDDLRKIFDRIAAAEEHIRMAQSLRGHMPAFDSAEAAGVTEERFQNYLTAFAETTDAAINEHKARLVKDVRWTTETFTSILNRRTAAVTKNVQKQAAAATKALNAAQKVVETEKQYLRLLDADRSKQAAVARKQAKKVLSDAKAKLAEEQRYVKFAVSDEDKAAVAMAVQNAQQLVDQAQQALNNAPVPPQSPEVAKVQEAMAAAQVKVIEAQDKLDKILSQDMVAAAQRKLDGVTQDIKNLTEEVAAKERDIAALQAETAPSKTKAKAKLSQLASMKADVAALTAQIEGRNQELISARAQLSEERSKVAKVQHTHVLSKASKELRALWAKNREDVALQVSKAPIEQVRDYLRINRLATDIVKAMQIPINISNISGLLTTKKGKGLDPNTVAEQFNLESGEAMLEQLAAETRDDKIDRLTNEVMLKNHGEIPNIEAMRDSINDSLTNDASAKFMATQLSFLAKTTVPAKELNKAGQFFAINFVQKLTSKDLNARKYELAESRYSKLVLKLVAKDPQGAIDAQRKALLNHHIALQIKAFKKTMAKAPKYFNRFFDAKVAAKIDYNYLEQIHELLRPVDILLGKTEQQKLKTIAKRVPLERFIEHEAQRFQNVAIDPIAAEQAAKTPYDKMTVYQVATLLTAVKQLDKMGRSLKRVIIDQKEVALDEKVADGVLSIVSNANREVGSVEEDSSTIATLKTMWAGMNMSLRKPASLAVEMDGGKLGFMWDSFIAPANRAGDVELRTMDNSYRFMRAAYTGIADLISDDTKMLRTQKKLIPGTSDIRLSTEQAIMFTLNLGTESGRARALAGGLAVEQPSTQVTTRFGVRRNKQTIRPVTEAEAQAIVDSLPKEAIDFVQQVWDHFASFRPAITVQERKTYGTEPQWLPSIPVQTKFGPLRGGYIPAVYDSRLSKSPVQEDGIGASTQDVQGAMGNYPQYLANRQFTKSRSDAVTERPLLLNFSVLDRHISSVSHYLAWTDWLRESKKLLDGMEQAIVHQYGRDFFNELDLYIQRMAKSQRDGLANPIDQALNYLQTGVMISALGWKLGSALMQFTGLSLSWHEAGSAGMAASFKELLRNPREMRAFANERSLLMQHRGLTYLPDPQHLTKVFRVGRRYSEFKESFFFFIATAQRIVDDITWRAAYEKAMSDQGPQIGQADQLAAEQKAAAMADQAVVNTQSSNMLKDLSRIQNTRGLYRIMVFMYSPFSAIYNKNVNLVRTSKIDTPRAFAAFLGAFMQINIIPIIATVILREMLKNECHGDPECYGKKMVKEGVGYFTAMNPYLSFLEQGVVSAIDGTGTGAFRAPGAFQFFDTWGKALKQTAQGELDEAFFKALNDLGGQLLHYPSGAINNVWRSTIDIMNGEADGLFLYDELTRLIAGPPTEYK